MQTTHLAFCHFLIALKETLYSKLHTTMFVKPFAMRYFVSKTIAIVLYFCLKIKGPSRVDSLMRYSLIFFFINTSWSLN